MRFQELRSLIFEQHKRFSAHLRGVLGSNPGKVNKFGQMKIGLVTIWLSPNLDVGIKLMTRSEEKYPLYKATHESLITLIFTYKLPL